MLEKDSQCPNIQIPYTWHKGYIMHLVQEIQGDRFLIANSVGKINGVTGYQYSVRCTGARR